MFDTLSVPYVKMLDNSGVVLGAGKNLPTPPPDIALPVHLSAPSKESNSGRWCCAMAPTGRHSSVLVFFAMRSRVPYFRFTDQKLCCSQKTCFLLYAKLPWTPTLSD